MKLERVHIELHFNVFKKSHKQKWFSHTLVQVQRNLCAPIWCKFYGLSFSRHATTARKSCKSIICIPGVSNRPAGRLAAKKTHSRKMSLRTLGCARASTRKSGPACNIFAPLPDLRRPLQSWSRRTFGSEFFTRGATCLLRFALYLGAHISWTSREQRVTGREETRSHPARSFSRGNASCKHTHTVQAGRTPPAEFNKTRFFARWWQ